MSEAPELRPVRFDGRYWTGVCVREATLMCGIIRNGWRAKNLFNGNGVPEGRLAQLVGRRITDEDWQQAIQWLVNHDYITLDPGPRNDSVRVVVAPSATELAISLCGERQLAGKPVDGE
jgi:hypothetical protein